MNEPLESIYDSSDDDSEGEVEIVSMVYFQQAKDATYSAIHFIEFDTRMNNHQEFRDLKVTYP